MNFLKAHIISRIKILYKNYSDVMGMPNAGIKFIYLDSPVNNKGKIINRIDSWYPYLENEIVNSGWHSLDGGELYKIYDQIKNNRVYIVKNVEGRFYKIRKK